MYVPTWKVRTCYINELRRRAAGSNAKKKLGHADVASCGTPQRKREGSAKSTDIDEEIKDVIPLFFRTVHNKKLSQKEFLDIVEMVKNR